MEASAVLLFNLNQFSNPNEFNFTMDDDYVTRSTGILESRVIDENNFSKARRFEMFSLIR